MPARNLGHLCLLLLALFTYGTVAHADIPPELKELERYIGNWKTTIEGQEVTATSKTAWIVQGQIVQQKEVYSDGAETLIMRGYDQAGKKYFLTLFDSRGVHWMMTGDFEAATNTFHFEGRLGDTTVKVKSAFPDKDTEDWTITFIDSDSEVNELRGQNKRIEK